jgi:hypothetical protein
MAKSAAEEILGARAYSSVHDFGEGSGVWLTLMNWWEMIQRWFAGLYQDSELAYWAIVAGLLLLLALIVWHLIWTIKRSSRWTGWEELDRDLPLGRDPETALQQAADAARQEGRLIEALSFRFRLALYRHARNHPGALRPGFTNRECLNAWTNNPAVLAEMTDVVRLLDRCWYAQQECPAEDFDHAWQILEGKQVE